MAATSSNAFDARTDTGEKRPATRRECYRVLNYANAATHHNKAVFEDGHFVTKQLLVGGSNIWDRFKCDPKDEQLASVSSIFFLLSASY